MSASPQRWRCCAARPWRPPTGAATAGATCSPSTATAPCSMYRGTGDRPLRRPAPADRLRLGLVHRAAGDRVQRRRPDRPAGAELRRRAADVSRQRPRRLRDRHRRVARRRLGRLHLARRARRLQRRRQARHPRRRSPTARCCSTAATATAASPAPRRSSAAAGRRSRRCWDPATGTATARSTCSRAQSDGTLLLYRGNGQAGWITGSGRADRQRLGRLHRADRPTATSAATASPTSSPATSDGRAAALPRQRIGRLHRAVSADRLGLAVAQLPHAHRPGPQARRRRRRRPRRRASRCPTAACGSTPATTASRPAAGST